MVSKRDEYKNYSRSEDPQGIYALAQPETIKDFHAMKCVNTYSDRYRIDFYVRRNGKTFIGESFFAVMGADGKMQLPNN